jgi:LmbE family N-acetylglucosaminyl deacetylase
MRSSEEQIQPKEKRRMGQGTTPSGCPDCTLAQEMKNSQRTQEAAAWLAIAAMIPSFLIAQQPAVPQGHTEAAEIALPLPEDRGAAALEQSLRRLGTWASLMAIVAHPDDEDGAMLTYESRGQGVRTSLLTLTRGEGGQNAMSADAYDALGVIRTNELLRADEFYGVKQYWGTEADFGFSKTQEESFARWGHERVLCDTVLAVRLERPLILVSTFVGGITDGHGQHQVSGEISQEAYKEAGDPKVCPEQIVAGLRPWAPLKVYGRVPFAPVTDKGMFDYATGKWAPVRFYNYVTKEWSTAAPAADLSIPSGQFDPVLGRSYVQIARQGWGEQKSQNGGANPTLSGGDGSEYHLYASRVKDQRAKEDSFFAGVPTGIEGLATLIQAPAPGWLTTGLEGIAALVAKAQKEYTPSHPEMLAPVLKAGFLATQKLREQVAGSQLRDDDKAALAAELDNKLTEFQTALTQSLGLELQAFTVRGAGNQSAGPFGGGIDETPRSVTPGQEFHVQIHTSSAFAGARLTKTWFENPPGTSPANASWKHGEPVNATVNSATSDAVFALQVPEGAAPTEPFFSRPSIEQAYYDVSNAALRGRSFPPYPLTAWAEFDYDGIALRLGEVVQTMQREPGRGGILEPLVITPPIGVRLDPESRILPLDGSPLPVRVTVHTEGAADAKVRLKLPAGWTASPAEASLHRTSAGDSEPIQFEVKPSSDALKADGEITFEAEVEANGHRYASGWQTLGYSGLRPYNLYRKAEMKTRAVDVKLAAGLRVGYVMGTGDMVPEAIVGLGATPHLLTAGEVTTADLSAWDVIVIGIRAYSVRPELAAAQSRLNAFVQAGGTLIVQYQSNNFPAPFALTMGRTPERVVEESAPVKILTPADRLFNWPNQITSRDFDGWVEERGHSFLDSWDPAYTALTETADVGQDAQRGGLLIAHAGKGAYVYMAYALYRQLPELVPGSYRLLANLLSIPKAPGLTSELLPGTDAKGK